jgi:hypothetical protein
MLTKHRIPHIYSKPPPASYRRLPFTATGHQTPATSGKKKTLQRLFYPPQPQKSILIPKNSFLMPQKSILMPQNSFIMSQNLILDSKLKT